MLSNIKSSIPAFIIIIATLLFTQCSKYESGSGGGGGGSSSGGGSTVKTHNSDYYASEYLRDEYMGVYYYWADKVRAANKIIDLDSYTTEEAFNKMLYSLDRWSWMEDAKSYQASATGTISGTWGVSFSQAINYYNDYGVYVAYILSGSPFEKHGVTRGAKLLAIGDVEIGEQVDTQAKANALSSKLFNSPNTFTFRLTDGTEVTFTESLATSLQTDYILCSKIFTKDDFPGLSDPVGYIHYLSFKAISVSAIDKLMDEFHTAGVKKVIVDLRYNGGGDTDVCQRLTSYLAPEGLEGKPYLTRKHNSALSKLDATEYLGLPDKQKKNYSDMSIGAEELYFIMQNQSASSSEAMFNGLKPYLKDKIHHVGQQSYGKPNGMYVLCYPGEDEYYKKYNNGDFSDLMYVFYPICFYNTNSEGEEIPSTSEKYSGFIPENERPDDIFNDFGVNESDIFACLTHIVTGQYPEIDQTHVKKSVKSRPGIIVESLTTEAQTAGHYGTDCLLLRDKIR